MWSVPQLRLPLRTPPASHPHASSLSDRRTESGSRGPSWKPLSQAEEGREGRVLCCGVMWPWMRRAPAFSHSKDRKQGYLTETQCNNRCDGGVCSPPWGGVLWVPTWQGSPGSTFLRSSHVPLRQPHTSQQRTHATYDLCPRSDVEQGSATYQLCDLGQLT